MRQLWRFLKITKIYVTSLLFIAGLCLFYYNSFRNDGIFAKKLSSQAATICNTLMIEQSEKRQLVKYMKNSNFKHHSHRRDFAFDVKLISVQDCTVHVVIQDKLSLHSSGGAYFKITARGENFLFTCPYTDNFDGSYDVKCRLFDALTAFRIDLFFLDFAAFYSNGTGLNFPLWIRNIQTDKASCDHSSTFTGWFRESRKHQWIWISGKSLLPTINSCRACLQQLQEPVDFIGDSHTRFLFFYMLELLGDLTKDIAFHRENSRIFVGNLRYYLAAHTLPWEIMDLVDEKPTTPPIHRGRLSFINVTDRWKKEVYGRIIPKFLIIGAGSWDIAHWSIENAVKFSMPALRNFILSLHNDSSLQHIEILVLNLPPLSETTTRSDHRNNALIAAYNALLTDTICDLPRVQLVDFFSMAISRSEISPDGGHYLYPNFVRNNVTIVGDVGKFVAAAIIGKLCNKL